MCVCVCVSQILTTFLQELGIFVFNYTFPSSLTFLFVIDLRTSSCLSSWDMQLVCDVQYTIPPHSPALCIKGAAVWVSSVPLWLTCCLCRWADYASHLHAAPVGLSDRGSAQPERGSGQTQLGTQISSTWQRKRDGRQRELWHRVAVHEIGLGKTSGGRVFSVNSLASTALCEFTIHLCYTTQLPYDKEHPHLYKKYALHGQIVCGHHSHRCFWAWNRSA